VAVGRLRILATEADPFPEWWPRAALDDAFAFVSARPDAVVLPMPTWRWGPEEFAAGLARARSARVPTAVYNRFDSWDDPARAWRGDPAFTDLVHEYCHAATVVAGPQLPLTGGPAHPLPLPYPPLVEPRSAPPTWGPTALDVHFAGFYREPGWAGPARDTRDRHHRGHLLAQLTPAIDPDRLLVRQGVYWESDQAEQQAMRDRSTAEMDRSAIAFAPAGYGYLTMRHADGWARGRVVLSEPVWRHILVPEPDRWAAGEIVLTYEPSGRDLAEVVRAALDDPDRLAAIARTGWEYGRRWTDPAAQARLLAEALASHRD
jgi:hypothetical protein